MKPFILALFVSSLTWSAHAAFLTTPGPTVKVSSATAKSSSTTVTQPIVEPSYWVTPIQDVVAFHQKEIETLNALIEHWNVIAAEATKRQRDLEQEIQGKTDRVEDLQTQKTKTSRQEASQLRKELKKANKDLLSIDKEFKNLRKQLTAEMRKRGKKSQLIYKALYQQVIMDIQKAVE